MAHRVHNSTLKELRQSCPHLTIAVDATSSMAGVQLDFNNADLWYASVQKCFGLPAGLAVMVCSPRAVKKAAEVGENNRYNSLTSIISMMNKFQTTHTPNVMGIYLLYRVMQEREQIKTIDNDIRERYTSLNSLIQEAGLIHLIKNPDVHSYTVLPVSGDAQQISKLKAEARDQGIILGNGYGEFKETTFRIANFPALGHAEIEVLKNFLANL